MTQSRLETSPRIVSGLMQLEQLVNNALIRSVKALVEHDETMAREVSTNDSELNSMRYQIEESCYTQLDKHLEADDSRALVGVVNVATNLERIGDYAARVAHLTITLLRSNDPYIVPASLAAMAEVACELVEGAVEAYLTDNDLLAEKVVRRDRELTELYEAVSRELMDKNEPQEFDKVMPMLWAATHLERVGERAISICERAIYVATGELKEFR